MMIIENKSYRASLVKILVKSFLKEHLFEWKDDLNEQLEERLNLNLGFKTNISPVETKNGVTYIMVYFEDENGTMRTVDTTIINSGKEFPYEY